MIHVGDLRIGPEERAVINEVLDSGRISEGKFVKRFEFDFAKKIGARYCVAVSSGTAALICGLLSLIYSGKIKKGSKVITTPLTYISTVNAIVIAGLEPVFVDTEKDGFNITPEGAERLLENAAPGEFSLILPVHLMGYACDMEGFKRVAEKFGVLLFEDAAQAHGTKINGVNVGNFSCIADYSFYIAHNIQVGEMGAITTNDKKLATLVRQIKANGRVCDCFECTRNEGTCPHEPEDDRDMDPRFTHNVLGYNFKTMEFTAALGVLQISRMDDIIAKRQENVKKLNGVLGRYADVLRLPVYDRNVSYLAYPVVIKGNSKVKRREFRKRLAELNIESRPLFGCIPLHQPVYAHLKEQYTGKLPNSEYAGANGFYIGCHQYIGDPEIEEIGKAFAEILK
jgi:dTDP-4-amino-4,6-dideoxygalactose transaminase